MTTMWNDLEKIILYRAGLWHWYVIGDYNDHVLAQGVARSEKTALRRADASLTEFMQIFREGATV